MNQVKLREKLKEIIQLKQGVKIERFYIECNAIHCFPILLGKKLLFVRCENDFELDGYMILRLKDITNIRSDESERFLKLILREEGIIPHENNQVVTKIDDWEDLFKELKELGKYYIVECERLDDGDFYLGEIIKVNKQSIVFQHFDGVGEWEEKPTKIAYKDITSVSVDKRYINIISKYVKPKRQK